MAEAERKTLNESLKEGVRVELKAGRSHGQAIFANIIYSKRLGVLGLPRECRGLGVRWGKSRMLLIGGLGRGAYSVYSVVT